MDKAKVIVIRGVLDYARVLGKAKPHRGLPKYDKGPLWSVDITPDQRSRDLLEQMGIQADSRKFRKLKKADPNRAGKGTFLSLKILENREDGEKNSPPRITDASGNEWDGRLIGNGTIADIKLKIVDYGAGSELGTYMQAIRILKLVPYESSDFEPLNEDDEYFATPEEAQEITPEEVETEGNEDLDDDVPF